MKRTACFLCACLVLFTNTVNAGNIVEDAITQKAVTAPSTYVGQKRGYATLGGTSLRWPQTNDYLVSVDPPRFEAGCGGISAQWGGLSYLKFEYLVKKLQRIGLSAVVAYIMASEVMSSLMSKVNTLGETMSNWAGNLSIDDCRASQKLVAVMQNPSKGMKDLQRGISSVKERMLGGGSDNYDDAKSAVADAAGNMKTADTAAGGALAACPADLNDVFLKPGSLLENMGGKFGYAGPGYINLIRGFVGDIKIVQPGGQTEYRLVKPCPQNSLTSIDSFMDGAVFAMPASGDPKDCALAPDSNRNLNNWVKLQVDAVIAGMKGGGGRYSGTQDQFLAESGTYNEIMYAVATGADDEIASEIAGMTARRYAYMIMQGLYDRTDAMITRAGQIMHDTPDMPGCRVDIVAANAAELDAWRAQVMNVSLALRNEYQRQDAEYANRIAGRFNQMRLAKTVMYREMAKKFNPALARKLAGGGM